MARCRQSMPIQVNDTKETVKQTVHSGEKNWITQNNKKIWQLFLHACKLQCVFWKMDACTYRSGCSSLVRHCRYVLQSILLNLVLVLAHLQCQAVVLTHAFMILQVKLIILEAACCVELRYLLLSWEVCCGTLFWDIYVMCAGMLCYLQSLCIFALPVNFLLICGPWNHFNTILSIWANFQRFPI